MEYVIKNQVPGHLDLFHIWTRRARRQAPVFPAAPPFCASGTGEEPWEICVPGPEARPGLEHSPFVMASPWFSCANKAEREGEDASFVPSFSKSGGGPGGGGGGGGGGRPGPAERTENADAGDATGPCGRQRMGSCTRTPALAGIVPVSQGLWL